MDCDFACVSILFFVVDLLEEQGEGMLPFGAAK